MFNVSILANHYQFWDHQMFGIFRGLYNQLLTSLLVYCRTMVPDADTAIIGKLMSIYSGTSLHQGGLHRGGSHPPNFRLQYTGVPKSPLLSLFCNSVYWLKPHNNVNSRPPNLALLPPPLYIYYVHSWCQGYQNNID